MLIIILFALEFVFKKCWRVYFYLKEDASVSDLHEAAASDCSSHRSKSQTTRVLFSENLNIPT